MRSRIFLILLLSLLLFTGCDNNNKKEETLNENQNVEQNNSEQNNNEQINTENLTGRDLINFTLFNIGIDLYSNKKYEPYKTEKGTYFLNLKNLKQLGYDIENFKKCEEDKTGVTIDPENKENLDYKEYPILIHVYCEFN